MDRYSDRVSIMGRLREVSLTPFIFLFVLLTCGCGASVDQQQEEALIGSYNQDYSKVSKAQLILMYSGFRVGDVDGVVGPDTRDALREFQKSRGFSSTGYIGNTTWAELMKVEQKEGPFAVKRLQLGLKNAGFDPGSIDGHAGWMTMKAISGFQQAKGLGETGRLNPETWTALKGSMPQ
ncbi:MAG: peptidoglycan-binding protein [Elusimicrobia bacterium]|nr:peptidoglycan-binding protein [Elusimicrobiota bacterium]